MANSAEVSHIAQRSRWAGLAAPLGLAAAAGLATVALHVRDPHVEGSWGQCPLNYVTGWDCPGCGGLRAVNHLTNLDLAGAASSNLLFVVSIPVLVALWFVWMRRAWRANTAPMQLSTPVTVMVLIVIAVFAVARNTGWGAWLAA
ncbi:MAG TPA: DUF2752 domain-containing protein [Nocardioides sp.]